MNSPRQGFTLIELVIALGIGLVVATIAFTGLRLAAQTLALTRQLALQNDLMRSGMLTALEDRDFWTMYDDPDDPANQGLRLTSVMPADPRNSYRSFGINQWDGSAGRIFSDPAFTTPVNNGLVTSPFGQENLILGRPFTPLSKVPLPLTNSYDLQETTLSGSALMPYARNVTDWGVRSAEAHSGRAAEEPWVVRPVNDSPIGMEHQRTLIPLALLEDDDFVAAIDMDRGFDPARPYQANDPRRWYRGYLPETPHSDKRFGRYGMCANLWKQPVLGWGQDAREPYGLAPEATPEFQSVTGPYGPYGSTGQPCQGGEFDGYDWTLDGDPTRIRTRTFTWQSNQIVFLQDALGNIGMGDYLPSGTILHTYGARALTTEPWAGSYEGTLQDGLAASPRTAFPPVANVSKPDVGMARIDERSDCRWAGAGARNADNWGLIYSTYYGWTTGATGLQNLTAVQATSKPLGRTRSLWMLLPASPFSGARINGFAMDYNHQQDTFPSDDTLRRTPNTVLDPRLLTLYQHLPWWGQNSDDTEFPQSFNRGFLTRPLVTRKPPDWPDTSIAVGTWMNGRQRTVYRVRWNDPVSGEVQGLSISSIGTTLSGARQQRKPTGGWAAWYGPGDARNSPTLDSPP